MPSRLLMLLLVCVCCRSFGTESPRPAAGVLEVELNVSKCALHFTLGAVLHTVQGTFKVKSGTIRYDLSSGQASGQVAVDVRSGETGDAARDRQMHEAVLESDRFPDAVFTLDHVTGRFALDTESQVRIHGLLRIHGAEHEMTIPATVKVQNNIASATARFPIPYVDWGMKDPSNFLLRVDKIVDVQVQLNGSLVTPSGTSR